MHSIDKKIYSYEDIPYYNTLKVYISTLATSNLTNEKNAIKNVKILK
jgi:hypothetical protein